MQTWWYMSNFLFTWRYLKNIHPIDVTLDNILSNILDSLCYPCDCNNNLNAALCDICKILRYQDVLLFLLKCKAKTGEQENTSLTFMLRYDTKASISHHFDIEQKSVYLYVDGWMICSGHQNVEKKEGIIVIDNWNNDLTYSRSSPSQKIIV